MTHTPTDTHTHTWLTKHGFTLKSHFRKDKSDWNTNQAILAEDEYFFHKLFPNSVNSGWALDVGAHVGAASIYLARLGFDVISVEALPENANLVQKSLELNGLSGVVLNNAISDQSNQELEIWYGDTSNTNGDAHQFIGNAFAQGSGGLSVKVPTISLDDLFKNHKIDHCKLLKMDCEGGEWPAFLGASLKTLKSIDFIVGEQHSVPGLPYNTREDLLKVLKNQFIDVSLEFGIDPTRAALSSFVLKNKDLP